MKRILIAVLLSVWCLTANGHVNDEFIPEIREDSGHITTGLPYRFRIVVGDEDEKYRLSVVELVVDGARMKFPAQVDDTEWTRVREVELRYWNGGYGDLSCFELDKREPCRKPEHYLTVIIPFGQSVSCGNGPDGLARDEVSAHIVDFNLDGEVRAYELYVPCQEHPE